MVIAGAGHYAGVSLVEQAQAQVGSGNGSNLFVAVGTCNQILNEVVGDPNEVAISSLQGNSGGATYANGAISGASQITPSDFTACGTSNVIIKSQFGPSSTSNPTASLDVTYTFNGLGYEYIAFASLGGAGYDIVLIASPPTVTAISPASGPATGGTGVTITGTGFTGAANVTIGGTAATSFTVVSDTSLTATTPAGTAGTASVLVTTPGGTNSANTLYTYVAAPTVTSISPTSGTTAGGTSVTITGTNLTGATAVTFGVTSATVTANSATSITATSPAGTGTVDVTVTTVGGTSATSPADQFSYVAAPTVTSISPTSGPVTGGTSVTITGTNFTGATAVKFGATSATSFTVSSATSITATSPAGTGTVDVTVTTAGGTSATSANDQFTYNAAPTVTSISPTSGPATGGTSVVITGTGFTGTTGAASVRFGTTNATSYTVNSSTQITTTAPAGSGTVDITVTNNSATSATSANDQFTYKLPAPTVTAVSPNNGPTAGGTSVTITGTNFTGGTSVTFGSTNATSFAVISATQITAIAPPGSLGIVNITVRTASGTSAVSTADQFTYAVPADSVNLRKLQATVTPMAAQIWGQAAVSAMQSAVTEGFAGGGQLISPSGSGVRINFSADPDDQQQQTTDSTARARNPFVSSDPFSSAYGSFDANARGLVGPGGSRVNDSATSRTDDAFSALGYAGPVKAQPLRASEPREWLGWAEISGATLNRWTAPTAVNAVATIASVYGDQVNFTAGLTRVLTPNFLVGVLGGFETFDYCSDAVQGRLTGEGWTVGAYAGWKLSSTIRLDAGLAYSGIGFDGSAGAASVSFAGNRMLVTGGLTGNYKSYGFLIEPSATIYALWEHENAYTDSLGTAQAGRDFSTGRASTGLKLAYPFAWTDTIKLSPYAGIYGDYYFNTDNVVIPGAGALPVTPVFSGTSARTDLGLSAQFAGGGQFTVGGERSGIGGNFSLWTYRARASIPF